MKVSYQNFRGLILDAADCSTEDQYIAETGGSADTAYLRLLWIYHTGGIAALRKELGLSRAAISREYGIPLRTLENWEAGVNAAPRYSLDHLAYAILSDH